MQLPNRCAPRVATLTDVLMTDLYDPLVVRMIIDGDPKLRGWLRWKHPDLQKTVGFEHEHIARRLKRALE